MPSINLAPGTQYIIAARKRRVRLYGIAVLVVFLFAAAWAALYAYHQALSANNEDIETKIKTANAQIETLRSDAVRVSLFEKRLGEVSKLLETHVGWNAVFADIERLLPPDTVLTGLEAASDAPTITLQGTTGQIDQVSLAIASLTASDAHPSVFKSGSIKNIQRQEQKNGEQVSVVYGFTMTLTFDPNILWQ